jgi:hypothetical protein
MLYQKYTKVSQTSWYCTVHALASIILFQVWMSGDGGLTYSRIHSFSNGESVVGFADSEQRVAFLTSAGRLYHSRPRSYQMLELELDLHVALQNVSSLLFDSTGQLTAIGLHAENGTIASLTIPLVSSDKVNSMYNLLTIIN